MWTRATAFLACAALACCLISCGPGPRAGRNGADADSDTEVVGDPVDAASDAPGESDTEVGVDARVEADADDGLDGAGELGLPTDGATVQPDTEPLDVTPGCPLDAYCKDDKTAQRCNAAGELVSEACDAKSICVAGACMPWVCLPNQKTCTDSATLSTCAADGLSASTAPCGAEATCLDGACVPKVCTPGAPSCNGDILQVCNTTGTGFTVTADCAAATVSCAIGVCKANACTLQLVDCSDGDPCTEDECSGGLGCVHQELDGTPCGAGKVCDQGTCKVMVCKPGATTCKGAVVMACDAKGLAQAATQNCADGGPCGVGTCGGGKCFWPQKNCDDGNKCTDDLCEPASGCVHPPVDGAQCSVTTACSGGACVEMVCIPATSVCVGNKVKRCNDFGTGESIVEECGEIPDVCLSSYCSEGKCLYTEGGCNDGKPCTLDSCNKGVCSFTAAPWGVVCSANGTCVDSDCCTCPKGQTCNKVGTCVSGTSCKGRCGEPGQGYSFCSCTKDCAKTGNCCPDVKSYCDTCDPAQSKKCSADGKSLLTYDGCLGATLSKACAFGCDDGLLQCKPDPCLGLSTAGACDPDGGGYCVCLVPAGTDEPPIAAHVLCQFGFKCSAKASQTACVPTPGFCLPGGFQCAPTDPDKAEFCTPTGELVSQACPGCATGPGGLTCGGNVALVPQKLTIHYQYFAPNQDHTGFQTSPSVAKPIGLVVYSIRYDANGQNPVVLAMANTGSGTFDLPVPITPLPGRDFVVLAAVRPGADGQVAMSVVEPETNGTAIDVSMKMMMTGTTYSWALPTSQAAAGTWTITTAQQSSALRVFDRANATVALVSETLYGAPGLSLAIWYSTKVPFNPGSCTFSSSPVGIVAPNPAVVTMLLSSAKSLGGPVSDASLQHEMAHWLHLSYGLQGPESGRYYITAKTPPGLAFTEGFADFFSGMVRDSSIIFDSFSNQTGMYWLDLNYAASSSGSAAPFALNGTMSQFMDPMQVASSLWNARSKAGKPMQDTGNMPFWSAIASKTMKTPPFPFGYQAVTWSSASWSPKSPNKQVLLDLKQTDAPAATVADYLQVLVCTAPALVPGLKAAFNGLNFPWTAVQCPQIQQMTPPPVAVTLDATKEPRTAGVWRLTLRLERLAAGIDGVEFTLESIPGVTLVQGRRKEFVRQAGHSDMVRTWLVRVAPTAQGEVRAVASWRSDAFGFHVAAPWRVGPPEPGAPPLVRLAPTHTASGVDLGRPIVSTSARTR